VHTISKELTAGRRRRVHSVEFKAQVVAECSVPGVSSAAVALIHGINANLARRWFLEAQAGGRGALLKAATHAVPASFVAVQMPTTQVAPATPAAPTDIRVELRRGPIAISVSWPCAAASECAAWLRELLR
jgi:transposase